MNEDLLVGRWAGIWIGYTECQIPLLEVYDLLLCMVLPQISQLQLSYLFSHALLDLRDLLFSCSLQHNLSGAMSVLIT